MSEEAYLVEQDDETCETAAKEDEVGEREEEPDESLTASALVGCGYVNLGIVGWLWW